MDTDVWIWIIIGIVIVALIVVGAVFFMRGRKEQRDRAAQEKAEKLRVQARESELAAREGEARAAQVKADAASAAAAAQQAKARAAQADVEANRLADSVGEHEAEAAKLRDEQAQTLRKADEVDPRVQTDRSGNPVGTQRTSDGRVDADRDGRADATEAQGQVDKQGQPITRPPASGQVPTSNQSDTTDQQRRDRV